MVCMRIICMCKWACVCVCVCVCCVLCSVCSVCIQIIDLIKYLCWHFFWWNINDNFVDVNAYFVYINRLYIHFFFRRCCWRWVKSIRFWCPRVVNIHFNAHTHATHIHRIKVNNLAQWAESIYYKFVQM